MALSKTKLLTGAALGWRCHMDEILLLFLISVSVINRNEDVSHNANLKWMLKVRVPDGWFVVEKLAKCVHVILQMLLEQKANSSATGDVWNDIVC